ncbi:MAG: polyphosphate kinase 1 [Opitutales bacterium]
MQLENQTDPHAQAPQFFNRELSWLAFNRRVLDLAISDDFPLLERVRFLSIVSSNLDEFFEIRVAGLQQQVDSGVLEVSLDGLGPREQLRRIHELTSEQVAEQYRCWHELLVPALRETGITFQLPGDLNAEESQWLAQYFEEEIFPVLTPLAIDPAHPYPQLINKGLNLLVWLDDPSTPEIETLKAVVPVPRILPRLVQVEVDDRPQPRFIFLNDIIKHYVQELFPGYNIKGAWAFRITRNSDLYFDEEEVENLLAHIEEELYKLRRGAAVRLEIEAGVHEEILGELLRANSLNRQQVFAINGPVNLLRLAPIYDCIDRADLKFPPHVPHVPAALAHPDQLFASIAARDFLLHHPYDSFAPVVELLSQAARDPKVFAIKQTLYRTSGDSPIVEALKTASRNGKQVTALVELKARFDEAANIQWARQLEDVGVHVVYGMVGLKTHCKCSLIVRREKNGLRRSAHLGTGNYNPKTARAYTAFSFLTAEPELTEEVAALFNTLTGFARSPDFERLLVAPFNLHSTVQKKIQREAENARQGKPARVMAKVNSLIDHDTIANLYAASQAGAKVDLNIRGICGLVPGVPGLSENIRVRSILGRYLEHSRIYYFLNHGGEPEVYLGSADWMPRNFFRRIESVFPLHNQELRDHVIHDVLEVYFRDNAFATELQPDGSFEPVLVPKDETPFSAQNHFTQRAEELRHKSERLLAELPT